MTDVERKRGERKRARGAGRLAQARATVYSIAAHALAAPDEEWARALRSGAVADALQRSLSALTVAHRRLCRPAVHALALGSVQEDVTAEALTIEYTRLFSTSLVCPHYETDYVTTDPFQIGHVLAGVTACYTAVGLRLAATARERPDHVAIELDFMAFLAAKEAYAHRRGQRLRARSCRETQARFFAEHIGRWGRRFAQDLMASAHAPVYRLMSEVLACFLAAEASYLQLSLEGLEQPPRRVPVEENLGVAVERGDDRAAAVAGRDDRTTDVDGGAARWESTEHVSAGGPDVQPT